MTQACFASCMHAVPCRHQCAWALACGGLCLQPSTRQGLGLAAAWSHGCPIQQSRLLEHSHAPPARQARALQLNSSISSAPTWHVSHTALLASAVQTIGSQPCCEGGVMLQASAKIACTPLSAGHKLFRLHTRLCACCDRDCVVGTALAAVDGRHQELAGAS